MVEAELHISKFVPFSWCQLLIKEDNFKLELDDKRKKMVSGYYRSGGNLWQVNFGVSLDIEVDRFSTSIKQHHWNIVENDVKHPKL